MCGIGKDILFACDFSITTIKQSSVSILKITWLFSLRTSYTWDSGKERWLFLILIKHVTECRSSTRASEMSDNIVEWWIYNFYLILSFTVRPKEEQLCIGIARVVSNYIVGYAIIWAEILGMMVWIYTKNY